MIRHATPNGGTCHGLASYQMQTVNGFLKMKIFEPFYYVNSMGKIHWTYWNKKVFKLKNQLIWEVWSQKTKQPRPKHFEIWLNRIMIYECVWEFFFNLCIPFWLVYEIKIVSILPFNDEYFCTFYYVNSIGKIHWTYWNKKIFIIALR